jgi:hypothetical protein
VVSRTALLHLSKGISIASLRALSSQLGAYEMPHVDIEYHDQLNPAMYYETHKW